MKKIIIFGITGSIGQQAYNVICEQDNLELCGMTFNSNFSLAEKIKNLQNKKIEIYSPKFTDLNTVSNYEEMIKKCKPDLIVNAITGFAGIHITQLSIKYKINLALANKESLVIAGKFINEYISNNPNWKLYPIDSEHSSLYYLISKIKNGIKKIYITASGGPFYFLEKKELENKKFSDAIKHPNWQMGEKISIDSATLINKCFEIIEAYYLFNKYEIEAIYHPQSIVHAMIELVDGTFITNMSYPDMRIPISLALNDFAVTKLDLPNKLDLTNLNLYFDKINEEKWLPIKWSNQLIKTNNCIIGLIIVLLDDYLIKMYKNNLIKFNEISLIIDEYISKYQSFVINDWNDIYKIKLEIEKDFCLHYGVKNEE